MPEFMTALLALVVLIGLYIYADVKRQQPDLPTEAEAGETFEVKAIVLDGDTVRVPTLEMDLRLARIDAPRRVSTAPSGPRTPSRRSWTTPTGWRWSP